jgi:hypothetical protein
LCPWDRQCSPIPKCPLSTSMCKHCRSRGHTRAALHATNNHLHVSLNPDSLHIEGDPGHLEIGNIADRMDTQMPTCNKKHWGRACVSECTKLANRRGHGALGGIGKHCRSKTHVPHYIQQHINNMCSESKQLANRRAHWSTLVDRTHCRSFVLWSTALAAMHTHFAVDSVGRPASAHARPKCILHDLIATDCPKGPPQI